MYWRDAAGERRGLRADGKGPRSKVADSPRGAAQLHTACNDFYKEIQNGSLATIKSLVEGASVLVSAQGSGEDIPGELVHIDEQEDFACCDCVDPKDHTTDVLFDGIDYASEQPDFESDEG